MSKQSVCPLFAAFAAGGDAPFMNWRACGVLDIIVQSYVNSDKPIDRK